MHMLSCRSLGFSIEDTALVNTAVPLADILGPPAAGLLADKLGNFGAFMGFVTALNGAASLALLLIPRVSSQVGQTRFTRKTGLRLRVGCCHANQLSFGRSGFCS